MAEQKADRLTADSQPESSSPNRELGTRHNAPHTADCRRTRVQVVSLPPTSMGQRQADTHPWRRRTCPHISLARLSDMLTCLHSPGTLPPLFTGTRRHDSRPRKPLDAMRRLAGCSLMLAVMCSTRAHAPPSMQTPCPGHTPPTSRGAWLMRHGMHMSTATPGNATHAGYTTAATRTPQHAHDDTHAGHENMPAPPPHSSPAARHAHTHTMRKEGSFRPKKERQHV